MLISKQQNLKAAIVLDEIQKELDSFKPLFYFPQLFTGLTETRDKYSGILEPYITAGNNHQWRTLAHYLHTNTEAFVAMDEKDLISILEPQLTLESYPQ